MLITWIDILFVVAGGFITVFMLRRRWQAPPAEDYPHRANMAELILTALALVVAAIGPNILVIALTPGMPEMPLLVKWALIPSLVLLVLVWVIAKSLGMVRLTNRIWTGVWVGAATTAALDVVRLTGFQIGLMPGNMPRMFGVLILDQMAEGPSTLSDFVGSLYHYWVSACFGLTYALLVGNSTDGGGDGHRLLRIKEGLWTSDGEPPGPYRLRHHVRSFDGAICASHRQYLQAAGRGFPFPRGWPSVGNNREKALLELHRFEVLACGWPVSD
jgi:hypothetical protein